MYIPGIRTAKNPYGKNYVRRKILRRKFLWRKFLRRKFLVPTWLYETAGRTAFHCLMNKQKTFKIGGA